MSAASRLQLDPRFSALWRQARVLVKLMAHCFGSAQEIMDWIYPTRKQRRDLLAWLAPLEALVRKLLLAEAQALVKRAAPAWAEASAAETKSYGAMPTPPSFRLMPTAQFRLLAPGPRPAHNPDMPPMRALELAHSLDYVVANGHRRRGRPRPAVRLAMRYAALLRAVEKPLPYVKRLALRLAHEALDAQALAAYARERPGLAQPRLRYEALRGARTPGGAAGGDTS